MADGGIGHPRFGFVKGKQETRAGHPARLLGLRGYKLNQSLFLRFPSDVRWRLVELDRDDLSKLLYLNNEPTWQALSDGTRSVIVSGRLLPSCSLRVDQCRLLSF